MHRGAPESASLSKYDHFRCTALLQTLLKHCLQVSHLGPTGEPGLSVTFLAPAAKSSDTAPALLPLMQLVRAIQWRRPPAQQEQQTPLPFQLCSLTLHSRTPTRPETLPAATCQTTPHRTQLVARGLVVPEDVPPLRRPSVHLAIVPKTPRPVILTSMP